jgi:hypothetical protein
VAGDLKKEDEVSDPEETQGKKPSAKGAASKKGSKAGKGQGAVKTDISEMFKSMAEKGKPTTGISKKRKAADVEGDEVKVEESEEKTNGAKGKKKSTSTSKVEPLNPSADDIATTGRRRSGKIKKADD